MAMTRKQRRLVLIAVAGSVLAVAVGLTLYGLSGQIALFKTPTEIAEGTVEPGRRLRIGGLVKEGSVVKANGGATVSFAVTDTVNDVAVTYTGLLPDLFREGQGVVAEGALGPDGRFAADTVLAKHDENYMPKEVVDSLKAQGVWQEGAEGGAPVRGAAPAATTSATN
ncbi:cytochrome c-type biogenesis protein CcmE [Pleomorphomonas sp. SM30]|uniref:Cytochrome c-type biogenesis protein CcmE n=2 Tax=Oharaeibacter diazotrophicus TaxID=1920512 RepID=A0A4R6RB22_9HYPH|nr:cytochrome c-type biogenesis protein CcmE [Oharaeibacter diazotrophicus]BBE72033.1 cytochrome c-type biogenesis protein CcmE [Pleomorphomonas sp. SM30]GLS78798.1 cytochrome c-type biogenesis protein CcmE [Oharaeibacter diazotrophicus]